MIELKYVLGIRTKNSWSGKYYSQEQLDDSVRDRRIVGQANTIRKNSWMTALETEELERNLAENDSYKKGKKC